MSLDTACSSGLYALDMAMLNLKNGTCDAAIVAGTSLTLIAKGQKHFHNLGVLSPDGKCKSFDNDCKYTCKIRGPGWTPGLDSRVIFFILSEQFCLRI